MRYAGDVFRTGKGRLRDRLISSTYFTISTPMWGGYTQKEIRPLISDQMAVRFLPHSVPSWSAQTVLRQVQKDFPDYSYKEAALNPTNPSDRATPWEADIINVFKRDRELAEFVATRDAPTGQFLTFARPFRLTDAACLSCHSTPAAAPPTMVDLYGKGNGYYYGQPAFQDLHAYGPGKISKGD